MPEDCYNKEQRKIYNKEYFQKNKEKLRLYQRKWRRENPELCKEYIDKYRNGNIIVYRKNKAASNSLKRKTDSLFKAREAARNLIKNAIKRQYTPQSKKTTNVIGCSFEDLRTYLEKQFDSNMNWDNHGKYWELEYIIPLKQAKTEIEVLKLCHYKNLRPAECSTNRRKYRKIELINE